MILLILYFEAFECASKVLHLKECVIDTLGDFLEWAQEERWLFLPTSSFFRPNIHSELSRVQPPSIEDDFHLCFAKTHHWKKNHVHEVLLLSPDVISAVSNEWKKSIFQVEVQNILNFLLHLIE